MTEHQDLSQSLSDVLDWVGLSEEEIQWRIKAYEQIDAIERAVNTAANSYMLKYRVGSRAEGLGLEILGSDFDMMYCDESVIVMGDEFEFRPITNKHYLLMCTTGVHPGYCRLKFMEHGIPRFLNNKTSFMAANAAIKMLNEPDTTHQGPANTMHTGIRDIDIVRCHRAKWPSCAREWLNRVRFSSYPPTQFVQDSEKTGIHIVPTGHKSSKYKDIEWRLSFALVELSLVRMWPNTLRKCYVLLKLLRKNMLEMFPHLSQTLSSYHLKTVLLWLAEELGFEFWNANPITECLMCCLDRLLCCVTSGSIPHYILRNNNLFDCEAGTSRQEDLIIALTLMLSKGPACVMDCNFSRDWKIDMLLKTPRNESIVIQIERSTIQIMCAIYVNDVVSHIPLCCYQETSVDFVTKLFNVIRRLTAINKNHEDDITMTISYIAGVLKSICGTIILSLSISYKKQMSNTMSFSFLKISEQLFTSAMKSKPVQLKLANFCYHAGQYRRAADMLHELTDMNYILNLSIKRNDKATVHMSECPATQVPAVNSPFGVFFMCTSVSLLFLTSEIHATLPALQYEMFSPKMQTDRANITYLQWKGGCALVDPIVFVYFLQYLCFCQLMKKKHADVAFDNLTWIVTKGSIQHKETALNIFGHCFMERGHLRRAKDSFVKSLRIKSKFAVAPLHLAVLICKAVTQ